MSGYVLGITLSNILKAPRNPTWGTSLDIEKSSAMHHLLSWTYIVASKSDKGMQFL